MLKTSNIFNWIVLCAVFASGVYFIYYANAEFSRDMNYYVVSLAEHSPVKNRQATLVLDYLGKKRVFSGVVFSRMKISDVLSAVSESGLLPIKLAPAVAIDGAADNGKKWRFSVNGEEIKETIFEREVRSGDEILGEYK